MELQGVLGPIIVGYSLAHKNATRRGNRLAVVPQCIVAHGANLASAENETADWQPVKFSKT